MEGGRLVRGSLEEYYTFIMTSISSLRESFPHQTFLDGVGDINVNWSDANSLKSAFSALEALQNECIHSNLDPHRLTQQLVHDIVVLKARFPQARSALHLLQLALCFKMMHVTMVTKQLTLLWKWTVQSLHDEPVFDKVDNFDPFGRIDELTSRNLVYEDRDYYVNCWLVPFYYSARENGHPFQELAAAMFPTAIARGMQMIRMPSGVAELGVSILIMAFGWEVGRPGERREVAAFRLLHLWYNLKFFVDEIAFQLGMFFSTFAGERHGLDIADEAQNVLARYSAMLKAHERLQLLIAIITKDIHNCDVYKVEFKRAIENYHAFLDVQTAKQSNLRKYHEGRIFSSLSVFIRNLLQEGKYQFSLEVVRFWKRLRATDFVNNDVMIAIPNRPLGIGFATGKIVQMTSLEFDESLARWRELVDAKNLALGDSHQLLNDDAFTLRITDSGRREVPLYDAGDRFEQAMRHYYLPTGIPEFLAAALTGCQGFVMIPYFAHPISALMAKDLGITLPYVSSWLKPLPDRRIKRVLIYVGQSISSDLEALELKRIFQGVGIESIFCANGPDGWTKFLQHYERDDIDVVWVIAHGEIDMMAPHNNYLIPHTDVHAPAETMPSLPEIKGRRLLVLNVCSGGRGAALGGLPDFGIAHSLVDSRQAVIAHLWPVNPFAAAYFGLVLASALLESSTLFAGYSKALKVMTNTDEAWKILDSIGCGEDSLARFRNNNLEWSNILNWGSSVFIQ